MRARPGTACILRACSAGLVSVSARPNGAAPPHRGTATYTATSACDWLRPAAAHTGGSVRSAALLRRGRTEQGRATFFLLVSLHGLFFSQGGRVGCRP